MIAYIDGGGVVPHRIVRRGLGPIARHHVVTRGDGCVLCDPPLALESVVGQVVARQDQRGAWTPLRDAPRREGVRRAVRTLAALPVYLALEVHPALARWTARRLLGAGRIVSVLVRRPMHHW